MPILPTRKPWLQCRMLGVRVGTSSELKTTSHLSATDQLSLQQARLRISMLYVPSSSSSSSEHTSLSPPPPQVNCIAFHPSYGTLATVGGDGRFSFWDKDARTKLKTSEAMDQPISSCAFNFNGNIFAYSVSYDWSKVRGYCGPNDPLGTSIIRDH